MILRLGRKGQADGGPGRSEASGFLELGHAGVCLILFPFFIASYLVSVAPVLW